MRSLLWLVFCAITLIGLLPMSFGLNLDEYFVCPDQKEAKNLTQCCKDKWLQNVNPDQSDIPQRKCCYAYDNGCSGHKYVSANCKPKDKYNDLVPKLLEVAAEVCKNQSSEWSADVCAKLKSQLTENCKQFSKYIDCKDAKPELEKRGPKGDPNEDPKEDQKKDQKEDQNANANGGAMALVADWMYWSITTIALIVLQYN